MSHQLHEIHNTPIETHAQGKSYPVAKRLINHIQPYRITMAQRIPKNPET